MTGTPGGRQWNENLLISYGNGREWMTEDAPGRIRKPQVVGSIPTVGSTLHRIMKTLPGVSGALLFVLLSGIANNLLTNDFCRGIYRRVGRCQLCLEL